MSDSQAFGAGMIRATQLPIFTQTQTEQSSLIASNMLGGSPPPQFIDSISASFYELNRRARGPQKKTQVIKIQASPPEKDEDEQYLAPAAKRKGRTELSQFFEQNQFTYRPQASQGESIRYVP